MAKVKTGLNYYTVDTDRYQDIKIKRLKKSFGCQGIAVYDYILCEIYRVRGCFLEWDESTAFDVAEYYGLKESLVSEIVKYCASVGLFNKELLCSGIVTSRSVQERYLDFCVRAKRKEAAIPKHIKLIEESVIIPEESVIIPEESEIIPEESEIIPEESEIIPENSGSLPRREVKRSKENISKVNNTLPQNAHARGGGTKNFYSALCSCVAVREDVWEAAAITGSFQNQYTQYYANWLQLTEEQRRGYPLNDLNAALRKQCGEINLNFYNAYCWCKDNLLASDLQEIYPLIVKNSSALLELQKLIKEVKKGKINNPGVFILKKLRQL